MTETETLSGGRGQARAEEGESQQKAAEEALAEAREAHKTLRADFDAPLRRSSSSQPTLHPAAQTLLSVVSEEAQPEGALRVPPVPVSAPASVGGEARVEEGWGLQR